MIAEAVIFPCLGLSLTLEVLHLNVFWLSGSLFLNVFCTRITDGHWSGSLCRWSVCIDPILRVQSLGHCLLLLAIIGICELVLLWAGWDELGRVNVSLEISSESMRPRLEILSARILNNLVGWLLHILSSVRLNWLLLLVCELNQLFMRHTCECLLRFTFLRLRKTESWHCALWVVLVLDWLSMVVWCCCSIWYALVQGLGVNWSTNDLLHWVHQLGECIQVWVLLLSLVVGMWGRAWYSSALRLSGYHPILLRGCTALLTLSLLLRHHGFCGRSDQAILLGLESGRCRSDGSEHRVRVVGGNGDCLLLGAYHVPQHVLELECHIRWLVSYLIEKEQIIDRISSSTAYVK